MIFQHHKNTCFQSLDHPVGYTAYIFTPVGALFYSGSRPRCRLTRF